MPAGGVAIKAVLKYGFRSLQGLILYIGADLCKYWQYIGRLNPHDNLKSVKWAASKTAQIVPWSGPMPGRHQSRAKSRSEAHGTRVSSVAVAFVIKIAFWEHFWEVSSNFCPSFAPGAGRAVWAMSHYLCKYWQYIGD